jgi:hypothetical protein
MDSTLTAALITGFAVAIPATITAAVAWKKATLATEVARQTALNIQTPNGLTAGQMIEQTHTLLVEWHRRSERMESKLDQHLSNETIHQSAWWDPDLTED